MRLAVLIAGSVVLLASVGRTNDWPRWRGPDGSGISPDSPLPERWSQAQNIVWKTRIPGEGSSSPIVVGKRVFLTSACDQGERRLVHCLDTGSGKVLWSRELADRSPERTSSVTGHAATTPVSDGQRVIAFFGNAGAVCYNLDGKQLWHRTIGEFDTELGLASSPILHHGSAILVCDHDGDRFTSFDSFLIALDVANGKDKWKTARRGLGRSWSTPILVPGKEGETDLVVAGQDHLRGYDPESGKERWRSGGLTGWVTPSPVFGLGCIFATSGKDGATLAVRPGGRGEVAAVWRDPRGGPYVCSPLLYRDCLYVVTEEGVLTCYEAKSGARHYRERLAGKFTSSPVCGDGRVYITNEAGTTYVLAAGPKFSVRAKNQLAEYAIASLAMAQKRIFLRTEKHLYCIAESPKK